MLDYAQTAMRPVGNRFRSHLDTDETLRLALTRAVEVIGEAAAKVSQPGRDAHPEIPWTQIAGTRNRLIHGYDTLNLDILWKIATEGLPVLVSQLQAILGPRLQ
jgi:uncharacterized protein with HEPN domain